MTFFSCNTEHDDLMKQLKEGTRELKRISTAIDHLTPRNKNNRVEECSEEDE